MSFNCLSIIDVLAQNDKPSQYDKLTTLISFSLFFFTAFYNHQGYLIQYFQTNAGNAGVCIDGYCFGKSVGYKSTIYWRCNRAKANGFVSCEI